MVHLILTYIDDCDTTGVELFHTKEEAIEYVLDGIQRDYEDCIGIKDEKDKMKMESEMAEAKSRLEEKGWWKDAFGNTYVHEEKEFTA